MRAEFRADYERYKSTPFLEKILRVSNSMFSVFTYWNLVRASVEHRAIDSLSVALLAFIPAVVVTGLVLGGLLLIRLGRRTHLLLFPIVAFGCALTIEHDTVSRLALVPCFAVVLLLLIHFIIWSANAINHR